jgi:hypothetical protein
MQRILKTTGVGEEMCQADVSREIIRLDLKCAHEAMLTLRPVPITVKGDPPKRGVRLGEVLFDCDCLRRRRLGARHRVR